MTNDLVAELRRLSKGVITIEGADLILFKIRRRSHEHYRSGKYDS